VLDRMQDQLDRVPDAMGVRQTVEHPFGTLKAWMGVTYFRPMRCVSRKTVGCRVDRLMRAARPSSRVFPQSRAL
jgi:hypothetical protein